jgi:hypothetical protein
MGLALAAGGCAIMNVSVEPPPPPPGFRRYGLFAASADERIASVIMTVAVYTIPVIVFALWVLRLQQRDTEEPDATEAATPALPTAIASSTPPLRVERPRLAERMRGGGGGGGEIPPR